MRCCFPLSWYDPTVVLELSVMTAKYSEDLSYCYWCVSVHEISSSNIA